METLQHHFSNNEYKYFLFQIKQSVLHNEFTSSLVLSRFFIIPNFTTIVNSLAFRVSTILIIFLFLIWLKIYVSTEDLSFYYANKVHISFPDLVPGGERVDF